MTRYLRFVVYTFCESMPLCRWSSLENTSHWCQIHLPCVWTLSLSLSLKRRQRPRTSAMRRIGRYQARKSETLGKLNGSHQTVTGCFCNRTSLSRLELVYAPPICMTYTSHLYRDRKRSISVRVLETLPSKGAACRTCSR